MESRAAFASLLSNRLKLMFVPNFFYSNLKAKLWTLFNEQSSVNFEQLIWYGIKLMLFTCISEFYYNLTSLNTITVMLISWWWWQFLDGVPPSSQVGHQYLQRFIKIFRLIDICHGDIVTNIDVTIDIFRVLLTELLLHYWTYSSEPLKLWNNCISIILIY